MINQLNFFGRNRLPLTLQTEAAECGLACICMIANYHGHDVDLNGLRQRFPVSLNGTTLETIVEIAAQLDLGTRAIKVELDDLPYLQTPAILHWDLNHFVVLKNIRGGKIHIYDPSTGSKVLSLEEASDHFTGIAVELSPTPGFKPQTSVERMRISQLWGSLVGLKRAMIQLLVLSILLQLFVLALPFYMQLVVDEALVKHDEKLLLVLALGFGGLTIIRFLTSIMREWTILFYGYQMSFQLIGNIFKHLIHLPTEFYEKRHMGDILSRIQSAKPIQIALTQSLVAAMLDGLMAIFTGVVIFAYSAILGFIVLLSVAISLLVTVIFYPIIRAAQEEMIVTEANENSYKIESIRASIPLKLFSAQNRRLSNWRNLFASNVNASVRFGKLNIIKNTLQDFIAGIQTVVVIYVGAKLVLSADGLFTIGMLFAFMSYRQSFTNSLDSLFDKYIEFRLLGLHLERIADISQTEVEAGIDAAPNWKSDSQASSIYLNNVRFRYSPSDPWVLDGIDLKIKAGGFVALTGRSGGGKTTLLKLILGLYQPSEGEIIIDGHPLTDGNRLAWRRKIGVVMQDDQLLSGTIAENISFFDPNMDMDNIHRVAKLAQIHDEIIAMPMGYLSLVGDMGSTLSGGQKQRVFLARALYKDPQVLLLDEGTANLDKPTEKLIVDIIANLSITRIIVAHRSEFIQRAEEHFEIS